ncbi:uncharacterized protein LOC118989894 [Sturnira hondurensis]|uniref:uncharacterized protein LOC118989894 n=1 Tax=Sturnira hondurensis TaxID=192404 RepID=UPI00187A97DE|nr:uncharacterized protein LOC118989894 [Sturnira hondurensis]
MVTLTVEGKPIDFLVNTGAPFSVLKQPQGQIQKATTKIVGATGKAEAYPWTTTRITNLGQGTITRSFLVIPDCPYPLLGRDLLQKLQATITFRCKEEGAGVPDALLTKIPGVWAETNPPGLAIHQPPALVQLLSTASPVRIRQYPVPARAKQGIARHLQRLLEAGILRECQSAWNTPLLPVQKPGTQDYRPVQDLREVNARVETIHPTVPNPYTLLSSLPPTHTYYSVLDLKDAFFCIPLAPQSQEIFAFEWNDPENGLVGQFTWTRLPQGFKNSPTIFNEALGKDLQGFRSSHPSIVLLQYVDDILIAAKDKRECEEATIDLLQDLERMGYRVSAKKAQIVTQTVSYLGYNLQGGQRTLSSQRIQAVLQIPEPSTKRQVREFLGAVGYCRLWILGFAELARPLHELTRGKEEQFTWTDKERQAFQALKEALVTAPALALPDLAKPFQLFVAEKGGVALGVLSQELGPWKRPVAYLSKKLDPVASGWPTCLRALAATSTLVKEASKLTLGQDIQVIGEHYIEQVLRAPPDRWLTNARLTQYQAQLLNPPSVQFLKTAALNPATLLPVPDSTLVHDCKQILDTVTGSRPDLRDQAYKKADPTLFTDGSSFIKDGQRYAGAAVTTGDKVLWRRALPAGTSAQRAELIGLTEALRIAEGKVANIYTDSRYAFATAHIHGAIYKERGLLTAGGKDIKNRSEILALLDAIWLPTKVAIIHCKGHQKGNSPVIKGNCLADSAAKEAATGQQENLLPLLPQPTLPPDPKYSPEEEQEGIQLKGQKNQQGWIELPDSRLYLPQGVIREIVKDIHTSTHLGQNKLEQLVKKYYLGPNIRDIIHSIVSRCSICARVNAQNKKLPPLVREEIEVSNHNFLKSLQALQHIRSEVRALQKTALSDADRGTRIPEPPEPGQWVWILNHRRGNLEPRWNGPFQDPGTLFTIKKLPTKTESLLKGAGGGLPPKPPQPTTRGPPRSTTSSPSQSRLPVTPVEKSEELEDQSPKPPFYTPNPPLERPHHQEIYALDLLDKVFPFFNNTQPEITESCWLCLSPRPPFYIGLGANTSRGGELAPKTVTLTNDIDRDQDQMKDCVTEGSLTLAEFHGRGTCYLQANSTLDKNPNSSDCCLNQEALQTTSGNPFITKASEGLWFVCTQGIFKCIVPTHPELRVSAYIIPQVYLYGGNPEFLVASPKCTKRAPLLIPVVATIGIGFVLTLIVSWKRDRSWFSNRHESQTAYL